jgi:glycosyltransferase involved in cell wall biosynthesis
MTSGSAWPSVSNVTGRDPPPRASAEPRGLERLRRTRRVVELANREGFDLDGAEQAELATWLAEPVSPERSVGRYLEAIHADRPDLKASYPDLHGRDSNGFARWAWTRGRTEEGLPEEILPLAARPIDPPEPCPAIRVSGFFRETHGLGEVARCYLHGLQSVRVPVTTQTVTLEQLFGPRRRRRFSKQPFGELDCGRKPHAELVCVNGAELDTFISFHPETAGSGRPTIGIWGWETDAVPQSWVKAARALDEVWTYSRYAAANVGQALPIPVVVVPPPVLTPDPGGARPGIEIPDGFVSLSMFDFNSRVARKNPEGLLRAFMSAFEPGEGPHLVIKTINAGHDPDNAAALAWQVAERPDIHLIDRELDSRARAALLARCDCYVSLHRAEGFGLPLAEAMALAKPVVATGYSGNTDFMTPANSYLVGYSLVQIGEGDAIYPSDGMWADPDLRHAATLMRAVWSDPARARAQGALGRIEVGLRHSAAIAGARASRRLQRVIASAESSQVTMRADPALKRARAVARARAKRTLFDLLASMIEANKKKRSDSR